MLWLVKNFLHPIRSTCHQYGIPALVCQTSDVRRHFAGKPVVASHVSCFLRLTSARWYEGQARYYSLTWDVTFAAFRTLSIHESWMPSVAAKSSASPIWTPIVFIGETTTCMIAKDELTMKSVILETINNDDDDDDGTLHFASAGKQWFSVVKKELVPRLSQLGLHSLQTIEEKLPTFEITISFHKFLIYIFIGGNCSKSRCFIMIADDFFVLWEHHNCFRRVKQKEKNHLPKHLWLGPDFIHFSVLPGGGGVSGFGGVGGRLVTGGCAPQYNKFACWMSFLLKPYRWPRLVRPFLPTMVLTPRRLAKAVEE